MNWISVKDRLPEQKKIRNPYCKYAVGDQNEYQDASDLVLVVVSVDDEKPFVSTDRLVDGEWVNSYYSYAVTHWMPLPYPPEEE